MKKITVNNASLKAVLKQLKDIVPSKTAITALVNVLFSVKADNTVSLTCSDLEVTIITSISCQNETMEEFQFLIPFDFLYKICDLNGDIPLDIVLENTGAYIKGVNDRFEINSLDPVADYPTVPEFPADGKSIKVDHDFITWLNRAIITMSTDTLRPAMARVCIDIQKEDLTIVSTNAHTLFTRKFDIQSKAADQLLVGSKFIKALAAFKETEILWSKNHIAFKSENTTVITTRLAEKFPQYRAVIPDFAPNIDFECDAFQLAIKRIWRFYNPAEQVAIWLLYTPEEYEIVQNLCRKWDEHNDMRARLRAIIKEFGLSQSAQIEERRRSFILERKEWKGENYHLVNNDCVLEWQTLPENHFDFLNSSYPFGNHYEYTNYYNDFGHNRTNEHFKKQLAFLLPELFRTLKPGRIHTVHLKNRIHYGSVTGIGFSVFHRFTHMVCDAMEEFGFQTMGFHYIPTDVVLENNQTYRLTFGEMQKDATKMGSGIPEEIWIFRKPPTTTVNAYADEPVKHNHLRCPYCQHENLEKEFVKPKVVLLECPGCKQYMPAEEVIKPETDYSLAHWQIDADAFWKSSGNTLLTPAQLRKLDLSKISGWWKEFNSKVIYDYEAHVKLLQDLDEAGKLSRTFTTLPLRSNTPYIWNDVNRMHGLNLEQSRRKQQNHICPQPYDEVDRVIELYSNPGDLVGDPFGGLGTTGVRAVKKKRRAFMTELNPVYSVANAHYLKETELKNNIPTLFDTLNQ